jgi:hypothetical protein
MAKMSLRMDYMKDDRNHPVSHAGGWLVAMIFIDGAG